MFIADLTFFSNLFCDCRWAYFPLLPFSGLELLQTETPPIPQMPTPPNRALAAPHASSSPDVDGRRCFQGCSGIPALLPELCLLAVSGLTLTSSGVGNSGIFPPNSRVFPSLGRNLHDLSNISVKVGTLLARPLILLFSTSTFAPKHKCVTSFPVQEWETWV